MKKVSAVLLLCLTAPITVFCEVSQLKPAVGKNGMVVSSDSIATAIGVKILIEVETLLMPQLQLGLLWQLLIHRQEI